MTLKRRTGNAGPGHLDLRGQTPSVNASPTPVDDPHILNFVGLPQGSQGLFFCYMLHRDLSRLV
jgi:hypothetical protein